MQKKERALNSHRLCWTAGLLGLVAALLLATSRRGGAEEGSAEVDDPRLDESSGLAISWREPQRFWTHNDSGDRPRLFSLAGPERVLTAVNITGATAVDWEDMASAVLDGRPTLVVGDIGDNGRRRESLVLYVVDEPATVDGQPMTAAVRERVEFRFTDGPLDCEAMAIDAEHSRAILIGKSMLPAAGVYAVDLHPGRGPKRDPSGVGEARRLATVPIPMATAMDLRSDGRQMAIAGYFDLFLFDRGDAETWEQALARTPRHLAMPRLKQIEAVCYDRQGALWVTSEGSPMPLVRVDDTNGPRENAEARENTGEP